jgi:hypothetical protein
VIGKLFDNVFLLNTFHQCGGNALTSTVLPFEFCDIFSFVTIIVELCWTLSWAMANRLKYVL